MSLTSIASQYRTRTGGAASLPIGEVAPPTPEPEVEVAVETVAATPKKRTAKKKSE